MLEIFIQLEIQNLFYLMILTKKISLRITPIAFEGMRMGASPPDHGPRRVKRGPQQRTRNTDDGVLTRSAFAGFCMAPLARPTGPEPRTTARVDEFFTVN